MPIGIFISELTFLLSETVYCCVHKLVISNSFLRVQMFLMHFYHGTQCAKFLLSGAIVYVLVYFD